MNNSIGLKRVKDASGAVSWAIYFNGKKQSVNAPDKHR